MRAKQVSDKLYEKKCSKCRMTFQVMILANLSEFFYTHPCTVDGFQHRCKSCTRFAAKEPAKASLSNNP